MLIVGATRFRLAFEVSARNEFVLLAMSVVIGSSEAFSFPREDHEHAKAHVLTWLQTVAVAVCACFERFHPSYYSRECSSTALLPTPSFSLLEPCIRGTRYGAATEPRLCITSLAAPCRGCCETATRRTEKHQPKNRAKDLCAHSGQFGIYVENGISLEQWDFL